MLRTEILAAIGLTEAATASAGNYSAGNYKALIATWHDCQEARRGIRGTFSQLDDPVHCHEFPRYS